MISCCSISSVDEVVAAFAWLEASEQVACGFLRRFNCSFCGSSHEVFELGKDLFDGVEIGTVGWQEEELCSGPADGLSNRLSLM